MSRAPCYNVKIWIMRPQSFISLGPEVQPKWHCTLNSINMKMRHLPVRESAPTLTLIFNFKTIYVMQKRTLLKSLISYGKLLQSEIIFNVAFFNLGIACKIGNGRLGQIWPLAHNWNEISWSQVISNHLRFADL
jgi:hypothetical protein